MAALAYHSSYSHRGKYYTLDEIARFDARGLWSCRSVWFSAHETLRRTCEVLVTDAEAGYATDEFEQVLHVGVKDPLRTLAGEGRIVRERRDPPQLHQHDDDDRPARDGTPREPGIPEGRADLRCPDGHARRASPRDAAHPERHHPPEGVAVENLNLLLRGD